MARVCIFLHAMYAVRLFNSNSTKASLMASMVDSVTVSVAQSADFVTQSIRKALDGLCEIVSKTQACTAAWAYNPRYLDG